MCPSGCKQGCSECVAVRNYRECVTEWLLKARVGSTVCNRTCGRRVKAQFGAHFCGGKDKGETKDGSDKQ